MLSHKGLKKDIDKRIVKIQEMMKSKDLGALFFVGGGAPGSMGAIRYLSNAHLWGGAGYVVLGSEDPDPWVHAVTPYQALWTRNETTTKPERVESSSDGLKWCIDLVKRYAGKSKRVGLVNVDKLMGHSMYTAFEAALEGFELFEVTGDFNAIRQIKTPFELEAIQQNGFILDSSLDVFRENARVGARYWDVCAKTEAYVKSFGAFWGRTKVSLDITPYTVPTPKDLTIKEDDIINFEIVYESPWGYWLEMTTVFAFNDLQEDTAKLLNTYLDAVDNSSAVAKAGNTFKMISDANDQTFRDAGYKVAGKHTPDCHTTGLDGSDGPNSIGAPDFILKPNMVLSYHPGTVMENGRGFLVSDNFLVTPEGATRMSPHSYNRYFMKLDK